MSETAVILIDDNHNLFRQEAGFLSSIKEKVKSKNTRDKIM